MDREMSVDYVIAPIDLSFLADAFAEQYLRQPATSSSNQTEPAAS